MLRRTALVVACLSIASIVFGAATSAVLGQTSPVGVSIQPNALTIMPSASVTVSLDATAPAAGLGAWTVNLQYDPTVLQVTNCTSSVGSVCNPAFASNQILVAGAVMPGLTGTADLADITFTAIGAPNSSSTLTPTIGTFADSNDSVIANPVASSGSILIDPPASAAGSTVTANPTSVAADGITQTTITVTANDSSGAPVPGKTITLSQALQGGGASHATIQAVNGTTNSQGTATFTATDATVENVVFTATDTSDSVQITKTASVMFVVGPVSATKSTVSATPTSAPADGSTSAAITVTLLDAAGHPIAGKSVSLSQATGHSTITTVTGTTTSAGKASFSVKDGTAETVTYSATDTTDSVTITPMAQVQFTPIQAPANAANSTIAASPATVPADGVTTSTVTVTLKDQNLNPVAGKAVSVSALSGHSTVQPASATTNTSGQASFSVQDSTAELVSYTAKDTTDGVTLTHTAQVQFVQPCSTCAISIQPASITVGPNDAVALTLQAVAPAAGLGAWQANVTYDPNVLQVASCTPNSSAGSILCNAAYSSNTIDLSGASSGLSGTQTLATLTFQAIGAVNSSSALTVSILTFTDPSGTPTAVTAGNGLVNLALVGGQGDVNLDGVVNAVDALCVLRIVAALPATSICPQAAANRTAADVNHDGKINSVDALCVLRIVSHLPATTSCPLFSSGSIPERSASVPETSAQTRGLAERPARVNLSTDRVNGQKGERTTVALTATAVHGDLGAWTVDIAYDPQAVTVVACEGLNGSLCNASYAAGVLRISGASASGLSGSQELAHITFEGVAHGQSESTLTARTLLLTDSNGDPLMAR